MNEMEQLNQSKEQLKESFGTFTSDLKNYTQARFLNFKVNVVQKVSSAKGKLGNLKNSFLEKLNPTNLDVKFRNIVEQAEIKGLELVSSGKEKIQEAKDTVNEFVTDQIANYYINQEQREEQRRIVAEERAREEAIKANTRDHKIGMREALREQARQEREARFLNFKENITQKVSSAKGKLGNLKNSFLEKLNPTNLDVKFRNIVEQAEIKGLELVSSGKEKVTEVKDKVETFAATQVANYYERKAEKIEAKQFREAARQAELEEIQRMKQQRRERKAAMKEALATQEREMYEQKHLDNEQRKAELMREVFGEPEVEQEIRVARAM